MDVVYSVNHVPIRLTEERWHHIVFNKPYMERYREKILSSVEKPDRVLQGYAGALIAVLSVARHKYLHVVYREVSSNDGFIITAFVSPKVNKRLSVWPRKY